VLSGAGQGRCTPQNSGKLLERCRLLADDFSLPESLDAMLKFQLHALFRSCSGRGVS
jgi:hypothetical protein